MDKSGVVREDEFIWKQTEGKIYIELEVYGIEVKDEYQVVSDNILAYIEQPYEDESIDAFLIKKD